MCYRQTDRQTNRQTAVVLELLPQLKNNLLLIYFPEGQRQRDRKRERERQRDRERETDRQTNKQTDSIVYRVAPQLKISYL